MGEKKPLLLLMFTCLLVSIFAPAINVECTTFVTHSPISIDGDSDFATQAATENWDGDGTQGSPYIIEGYEITGSSTVAGIEIANTTSHFIIRNCVIHDGDPAGISLLGIEDEGLGPKNGKIENCTIHSSWLGIAVTFHAGSNNIVITENHLYNNEWGAIYMVGSSFNVITKNNIHDNERGIHLTDCPDTRINYNNIHGNPNVGLHLNYDSPQVYFVNATYNWWGANDGPSGFTTSGSGDELFGIYEHYLGESVLIEPWLEVAWGENQHPYANFTHDPLNPTSDDTIQFTDLSYDLDGYIVNGFWDFGDGKNSTTKNPTHKYDMGGSYGVTLTVEDDDGLFSSFTLTVVISSYSIRPLFPLDDINTRTVQKGVDLHSYFLVTNNGQPLNGVTVWFYVTLGLGTWHTWFESNNTLGLDGIVDVSWHIDESYSGDTLILLIDLDAEYNNEAITLQFDGQQEYEYILQARTGESTAGFGVGVTGSVVLGAGASGREYVTMENDGSNVLSFKDNYGAAFEVNAQCSLFEAEIGIVSCEVGAEAGVGAMVDASFTLDDLQEQQAILEDILIRALLLGVVGNPTLGPLVLGAVTSTTEDILDATTLESIAAGVYATASANLGASIGFSSTKEGAAEKDASLTLANIGGGVGYKLEFKTLYLTNGEYEDTCKIEITSGVGFNIASFGGGIPVGGSVELGFRYQNTSTTIPKTIRLSIEIVNPDAISTALVGSVFNYFSILDSIAVGAGQKVLIELFWQVEPIRDLLQTQFTSFYNNLTSGELDMNFISEFAEQFLSIEVWSPSYEVYLLEQNSVEIGISGAAFGVSVGFDAQVFEEYKYLTESGYISVSGFLPIKVITESYSNTPQKMSVVDYIEDNYELSELVVDTLETVIESSIESFEGLLSIIPFSPVRLTITDELGRTIGYKDGKFINEIPGAYMLVQDDTELYAVPANSTYTITASGYDDGDYELLTTHYSSDLRSASITRESISANEMDVISVDGGLNNLTVTSTQMQGQETTYSAVFTSTTNGDTQQFICANVLLNQNSTHHYNIPESGSQEESLLLGVDEDNDGEVDVEFSANTTWGDISYTQVLLFNVADYSDILEKQRIQISTNSTLKDFIFDQTLKQISFVVSGQNETSGFCNVTIPEELLWGDFSIYLNDTLLVQSIDYSRNYNGTHNTFHIPYSHSSHVIEITGTDVIPEFASYILLIIFFVTTIVIIICAKIPKLKCVIKEVHAS